MENKENPWKTLSNTNVYENPWIKIEHHEVINPNGHGKIEFFASGLEGVLILLAALYIFLHAWQHLYARPELKSLDLGIIISLSSATINGILGYYLVSQGKSSHSPAILADGKHLKLDALNGVFVVIALVITYVTNLILRIRKN